MILVGRLLSPFVRRVAATLNFYGLDYEHRPLQHTGEEALQLRQLNPVGRVPALVLDDSSVLVDSSAILDHLDRNAGAANTLTPLDGPERSRIMNLTGVAAGGVEKAIATAYEVRFRPEDKRHQPWVDRCSDQTKTAFEWLDDQLTGDWYGGDKMSQADLTTAINWQFMGLSTPALRDSIKAPKIEALAERLMHHTEFSSTLPE